MKTIYKNKIALVAGLILFVQSLLAQQSALFNTYSYDLMQLNIASIGRTCVEANLNYRAQWLNVKESPRLYQLNAGMALGANNGVGLKVFQQSLGLLKVTNATAGYAFRVKLNETSKLHLGLGASWSQNNFDAAKTTAIDKNDPTISTNQTQFRSNNFDCEAGALFLGDKLTAGLSANHIYNSNGKFDVAAYKVKPQINLMAAYKFNKGKNLEVEPWLVNRYTLGGANQPEAMVNVKLIQRFTVAAGYRVKYGLIGMAGFEFSKFKIAYSFDYGVGKTAAGLGSSHQILLGIDLCKKHIKPQPDSLVEPVATSPTVAPEPVKTETIAPEPVKEEPKKDNVKAEIITPDPLLLNPMAEENVSLEGIVSAGKKAPDAFKNVKVKLLNENGELMEETRTNNVGAFAFRNIPANQNFIIAVDDEGSALPPGTKVTLTNLAGKEVKSVVRDKNGVNFKIIGADKKLLSEMKADDTSLEMGLKGYLYDQNMKPLSNTHLTVSEADGSNPQKVTTTPDGRFDFKNLSADKSYVFEIDENDPSLSNVTFVNVANIKGKVYRALTLSSGKFAFKLLEPDKRNLGEFKVEDVVLDEGASKPVTNLVKEQPQKSELPKLVPETDVNPIAHLVVFGKNSYTVSPQMMEQLKEIAKQINTHSGNVVIVGYASPEGEQHHNLDLAIHRAEVVKQQLIKLGVKATRLSVKNGGSTNNLDPNLEANRTERFE